MQSMIQDVRYTLRQIRKTPKFALITVMVLALGLGANIAVFTLLNGVLLRPLPYGHPDRIVSVELSGPSQYYQMHYGNAQRLSDAVSGGFESGMVLRQTASSVVGPGGRAQIMQRTVTAGMLRLLGVPPMLGRTFRKEENDPGREHVAIFGEDAWRSLFQSDPQAIGKNIRIRGEVYTVVGVMPKGFSFPFGEVMQIWSPDSLTIEKKTSIDDQTSIGLMFARLPSGLTAAQLEERLSRAQALFAKEFPGSTTPTRIRVRDYHESLNPEIRKPLLLLYAVVFGLWALACLNVTSLMLARAVTRMREQAVRTALGASCARLLQQSIIESLLLSGMGAAIGLILGQSAIWLLWHQLKRNLPRSMTEMIHMDWRVVAGMLVLALLTTIFVGVFPALRAMRHDVRTGLQGIATTASAGQTRTREALVVAQIALTLMFLSGAGLFLRTIYALRHVPLGFSHQNVLTGGIILNLHSLRPQDVPTARPNIIKTIYLPVLERVRAIPGVRAAALSSVLPLRTEFSVSVVAPIDHQDLPESQAPQAEARLATAGLTEALGIPMTHGRFFADDDTDFSPPVAVINQAFANRYLAGRDPIGHVLSMGKGRYSEIRIIGVIGNMKQYTVTSPTQPEIYFCIAQLSPGTPLFGIATAFTQIAIRGEVPAEAFRMQFDRALHEVAPDAATIDVKTMREAVEDSFGFRILIAHLLESFAILALMIAVAGLYGLLSFSVAQRTRELGLRIALGAQKWSILNLVLRRALLLVGAGLAIGGVLAWFAVSLTRSYIYGVAVHDEVTFAVVIVVLAATSMLAAYLPARRATAVDPILALKSE